MARSGRGPRGPKCSTGRGVRADFARDRVEIMSDEPSVSPSNASPAGTSANFAVWLAVGAVAVWLLFLVYAEVPEKLKRPGLSAVVLGAISGWGMGRWAVA